MQFLKENNKINKFIIYPLIGIFLLNLFFFIFSSFYDYEIMELFSKLLKFDFFTYFACFYHQSGYTDLYVVFALIFFIFIEYALIKIKNNRDIDKDFWSWIFLFLIIIFWTLFMYLKIKKAWEFNFFVESKDGKIIDFNIKKFIGIKDFRIILIFVGAYQFLILIGLLFYAKNVFFKKPYFYENKYWIKGFQIILFFFLAYGMVGNLKIIMGRDYYNGIENVLMKRTTLFEQRYAIIIKFNPKWITSPDGYQPWWIFNGLIGNPDKIKWDINKLFNANAFPSGHMAQMGMCGFAFIFIIDFKNPNNLSKGKIAAIYLFFVHQLFLVISFLINGSHWLTDTTFTWMWIIICSYLSIVIVNKIVNKKILVKS
ncbi:putative prolipoprotein [Mesoplasma florum W37]|uniref:Conserved hypothetical prolipoprotein n=1 Tax=Mesoplasma florum TaxID=2151 RepID=A0AAD2JDN3_MESFO|nr:phosphatase PAP2 family protein [Mesoplasma florum]AGY41466.1 putative prolipoprotein [Mesoplasma florum W37]AVN59683.1 hypothetical protein CG008_02075 [Mesoplasma florum]AVN65806.1 Conserved hypothetical prolipoprotein [Mesoplasma florum]